MDELEEELLRDDSTSCTSSLATTISVSEDADDLHLGAEANSFVGGRHKDEDALSRSSPSEKPKKSRASQLVVMKQLYSSFESCDTNRTYSSISGVGDLLAAREYNANEVLFNLGFASHTDEDDRRSILSRFKPSPLLSAEDNKYLDEPLPKGHKENHANPDLKDSINKAEEWLAQHHEQQNGSEPQSTDVRTLASKASAASEQTSAINKRAGPQRANKLRRRFSKSRQSSFELLLPKLKEEDWNHEGESADETSKPSPAVASAVSYATIRESSLEHAGVMPASTSEDMTEKTISSLTRKQERLSRDGKSPDLGTATNNMQELNINPIHCNSKRPQLAACQTESFELEEINSNNEDPVDTHKHRRVGVVALTTDKKSPNLSPLSAPGLSSGEDENETSSGFDEEDALATVATHDDVIDDVPCRAVEPSRVVESIQTKCWCGATTSSCSPPRNRRYVYDVTLGENCGANDVFTGGNINSNNNSQNFPPKSVHFRTKSVDDISCGHLTLRSGGSNGAHLAPRCIVASLITENDTKNTEYVRKCRRSMSDKSERRKDFATRSALSGDSMREMTLSSSLVKHRGNYVVRKRRSGSFQYFGKLSDFSGESVTSLVEKDCTKNANVVDKPAISSCSMVNGDADTVSTCNGHSGSCLASQSAIIPAKSKPALSVRFNVVDAASRVNQLRKDEAPPSDRKSVRQRTLKAPSSNGSIHFQSPNYGQCYG
ncbi:unnamed protein product [Clavelina lepadiformis]|uniref:Uncharacterized protein n=1 Tax=Clavelina lepadiformis TaxID=159417 RepID=A0ABP0F442_CLALP